MPDREAAWEVERRLRGLAEWLVAMDEPGSTTRRTITLDQIIEEARASLAAVSPVGVEGHREALERIAQEAGDLAGGPAVLETIRDIARSAIRERRKADGKPGVADPEWAERIIAHSAPVGVEGEGERELIERLENLPPDDRGWTLRREHAQQWPSVEVEAGPRFWGRIKVVSESPSPSSPTGSRIDGKRPRDV